MNWKTILIVTTVGLLCFGLGWFCSDMNQFANGVIADGIRIDSFKEVRKHLATVTTEELDSLTISSHLTNTKENFASLIVGRFVIKDAECAGFNFINSSLATWTNEINCWDADTLKLRWLDNATFFTQDIKQVNKDCPPRVWIYQVISFDGERLILKDIWTGWNNSIDTRIELIKQMNSTN